MILVIFNCINIRGEEMVYIYGKENLHHIVSYKSKNNRKVAYMYDAINIHCSIRRDALCI